MKTFSLFITTIASIGLFAPIAAQAQTPLVMSPAQVAISQPLTQGTDNTPDHGNQAHKPHPLPHHGSGPDHDDALQGSAGPLLNTQVGTNFPGVGANGYAPPDTNMAVGPNHILQTVNSRYAIYSKSGALLVGPFSLSSIWAALGSGSGCATNNGGDVVAQYDKLADRFIVTQLGGTSAPFSECIAVSKTSDPAGAYWLYSYAYGNALNDYPKFGVWPTATNSAYLASYNMFANAQTFTGGQLCAYDRTKMLAGDPSAQGICYDINLDGGFLPADLDGSTPPLDGTPGYFLNYETLSSLRMYALAPNFANPAASTLTVEGPDIPVTSFAEACASSGDTCIPQQNTHQKLDALGDRLMYRLAFRNFGDHEAVVVNHSVAVGGSVGVRWYELRAPVSTSGAFSLYQQGTYAPDAIYRWMGSAAMDALGNIGIGYSASSGGIHPAIRYTGRSPGDPLGTLQSEVSMVAGTGSQTQNLSRWGDYTAMRIDPADDCTFWYTNEYLLSNGSYNWQTAFGSFKFNSCTVPDFSMSANPTSLTLIQGASGNSTITVTALNGLTGSIALAVTGCPTGATCSIATPVTPNPTATSTLSVTTNSGTSTGNFTLTITGTKGALTHTTTVALTVNPPANFSISANPTTLTLTQGGTGTSTTTVTALNGFSGSVALAVTGCPTGATCSLPTPVNPNPTATSTLTVTTNGSTSTGTFPLTITGTSGALVHTATVTLTVNAAGSTVVNVALASNLAVASASSTYSSAYPPSGTIDGDTKGLMWGNGGGWNDSTPGVFPDFLQVDFNGTPTINEVDVFSVQDNYSAPIDPTPAMTFSLYGLRDFEVQYWTGTAWAPIPGASVTGNNLVWRKFSFAALATSKIRVAVTATADGFSRITEVQAFTNASSTPDFSITANPTSLTLTQGGSGTSMMTVTALSGFSGSVGLAVSGCPSGATCSIATPVNPNPTATSTLSISTNTGTSIGTSTLTITGTSGALVHTATVTLTVNAAGTVVNVALASNGGVALASSTYSNAFAPAGAIDGDTKGLLWGNGGGWNDGTPNVFPDMLEVDFNGTQTINEVDVFSVQDNYSAPSDPTPTMTFSLYGLRDFEVQYWTGSAWAPIPGASVTGNNLVWRRFNFTALATSKIRISVTATADGFSRITEVQAFTASP